jgi:Fe2+ transport system protein FeoA
MSNSELATQDWTLADLPIGVSARVIALDPSRHTSLAGHGIRPGVIVEVEADAPFGGPRIVNLGSARLAIARAVARTIRVRRGPDDVVDRSR